MTNVHEVNQETRVHSRRPSNMPLFDGGKLDVDTPLHKLLKE